MGLDMYLYQELQGADSVQIGYWRKANAIHRWFVENVQDGNDDCGEYEVSADQLRELLELCRKVLESAKLVKGQVWNGTRFTAEKGREEIFGDGLTIEDSTTAEDLLPTTSGFFFGSTNYDQYYLDDIRETVRIIESALEDFGDSAFYYSSSW